MSNNLLNSYGVIGGMGPASTNLFLSEVVFLYSINLNARKNNEFPRVTVITIPDSNHMNGIVDNNLFESLSVALDVFVFSKNDFFVAPCNTIHHYLSNSVLSPSIPILSIISAVEMLYCKKMIGKKVLFLSTTITRESNIYLEMSKRHDIFFIYLNIDDQKKIDELIIEINGGVISPNYPYSYILKKIIKNYTIDCVFLACTELSIIKNEFHNLNVIDSLFALSKATFLVSSRQKTILDFS